MRRSRFLLAAGAFMLAAATARAATYLPISDAELAGRSPVIVRGLVLERTVSLERVGAQDLPFTVTTVQVLESFRGAVPGQLLRVRVPGGIAGGYAWWVPGAPVFSPNQQVVLLLRPAEGRPGEHYLSEFGLSRFDLAADESGHRFAVRPAFDPEEDLYVSKRSVMIRERAPGLPQTPQRDADSFLVFLRSLDRGTALPEIEYAQPRGALGSRASMSLSPEWINLGGVEPGTACGGTPCLFRWFWDTSGSPTATVSVVGTQSLLSDGSSGIAYVQNGVDQWHTGVPASDIHVSGVSPGGNVTVNLDAASSFDSGATWSSALPCGTGGTIGLGGPGASPGPVSFKGDTTYYSPNAGTVSMRLRTGTAGCYDAATFRTAVMHEIGHVLGLGHPDQGSSTHSTTTSTDWANAVMHSTVPPSKPSTPQTDDVQGMQYYYGTGAPACVPNTTTLCIDDQPGDKRFKLQVAWSTSQGGGQAGNGTAISLSSLGISSGGIFWFFSASNPEMLIKVIGACPVNGHHWVFASAGTNVGLTVTVTDTSNGAQKAYHNQDLVPAAPIQDVAAFACP
jgi:hypothetical protein